MPYLLLYPNYTELNNHKMTKVTPLRKNAYSNMFIILSSKNENFQIKKKNDIFDVLLKT